MTERPHGYARYRLDNCRCYVCSFAVSQYEAVRQRAIAYGTWQPFIDPAPVRDHIRLLQECGIGARQLSRLSHVSRSRIREICSGEPGSRGVRPATAARILAVEPTIDNVAPHTDVDATGTHRRLQALVARGFPQTFLGRRLGAQVGDLGPMLKRIRVTAETAAKVRDLYSELWNADPLEHGVIPVSVTRARNYAASREWAPAGAWDEDTIDDPAAFPDWTGQCGTPQGYRAHEQAGLPTCQPCRDAHAEERRLREQQKREAAAA